MIKIKRISKNNEKKISNKPGQPFKELTDYCGQVDLYQGEQLTTECTAHILSMTTSHFLRTILE